MMSGLTPGFAGMQASTPLYFPLFTNDQLQAAQLLMQQQGANVSGYATNPAQFQHPALQDPLLALAFNNMPNAQRTPLPRASPHPNPFGHNMGYNSMPNTALTGLQQAQGGAPPPISLLNGPNGRDLAASASAIAKSLEDNKFPMFGWN